MMSAAGEELGRRKVHTAYTLVVTTNLKQSHAFPTAPYTATTPSLPLSLNFVLQTLP